MEEKKMLIIKQSMELFSKKGFAATSVQEIATACGMSKGAFYLHFHTKESLLLTCLHYYFQLVFHRLADIEKEPLAPRDLFIKQLEAQISDFYRYKEFFILQTLETAIPSNEEVGAFLFKMRTETHQLYRKRLLNIYGEDIKPYVWDLSLALQGIQQSFFQASLADQAGVKSHQFAEFLLACADNLASGFRSRAEKPLLNPAAMNERFQKKVDRRFIHTWIAELKKEKFPEDIVVSLEVIEQEIAASSPRAAILRGMLANLSADPRLQEFAHMLKDYYQLG